MAIDGYVKIIDHACEILLLDCCKLAINQKNDNYDIITYWNDTIIDFFWYGCVCFVQVSCQ